MGIQTQIDRIKGEVETQTAQIGTNAALIEQIKAALDGKAAGGGGGASVETCTVTLINERDYDIDIIYASTTGCESTYMTGNSTFSFEAKKGSIIVLYGENLPYSDNYYEVDGNIERIVGQISSEGITLNVMYVDGDCTFRTIS